jgi:histone-lysine N-methyltransferase SETMAR
VALTLTFLERYHKNSNEFLNHIVRVTGDETWDLFLNVGTKGPTKQWMYTHSPNKPKKSKQRLSARKLMTTDFWDRKGVLMVEFMQQGTTIMSEVYCKTVKSCVGLAIQNKRHGVLTPSVVLLHDNTSPHTSTAACTPALLEHFNWELFDHPPYSPDLAPSDYHLFTYLKNRLGPQRLNNNEELMEGVKTWLSSHAADFFETGIQKIIPRYDKCFNSGGDYVGK